MALAAAPEGRGAAAGGAPSGEPADESARLQAGFAANMSLPVHKWYRYSAGFSAAWAESVIRGRGDPSRTRVLDPFAGPGTTLLAAQSAGAESIGWESHPFVARVARAKLAWTAA